MLLHNSNQFWIRALSVAHTARYTQQAGVPNISMLKASCAESNGARGAVAECMQPWQGGVVAEICTGSGVVVSCNPAVMNACVNAYTEVVYMRQPVLHVEDCQSLSACEHCMCITKMYNVIQSHNVLLGGTPASSPDSCLIMSGAVQGTAIGTCPGRGRCDGCLLGFRSLLNHCYASVTPLSSLCHATAVRPRHLQHATSGECIDMTAGCSNGQLVRVE